MLPWLGLERVCLAQLGGMRNMFASLEAVVSRVYMGGLGLGRATGSPSVNLRSNFTHRPPFANGLVGLLYLMATLPEQMGAPLGAAPYPQRRARQRQTD